MGAIVIITCVAFVLIIVLISIICGDNKNKTNLNMLEIHKCNSIRDIVMAINCGRIYPYFTGMNLTQVVKIIKQNYNDTTNLENHIQLCEMIGFLPSIDLPEAPNAFINRISIGFNRNKVASSITIDIKNFQLNKTDLVEQMILKFGKPMSIDRQFMIWRDAHMIVNIDATNGCISVIDERIF